MYSVQRQQPSMINVVKSRVPIYRDNRPVAQVFCYGRDPIIMTMTKKIAGSMGGLNEVVGENDDSLTEVDKSLLNTLYIQRDSPNEQHEMYHIAELDQPIYEFSVDIEYDNGDDEEPPPAYF